MSPDNIHYDESKVPDYTLPDPLTLTNGDAVRDEQSWLRTRRPEIVALFETHVYGKTPQTPLPVTYDVFDDEIVTLPHPEKEQPVEAIRRQIRVGFTPDAHNDTDDSHSETSEEWGRAPSKGMDILLYLPKATRPAPVFIGLNFAGNHATQPDPAIKIPESWMRDRPGTVNNRATEEGRGLSAARWPIARIVAGGYGVATAYYGDIDPDFDDGFQNGIHPYFSEEGEERRPDSWGTIGAWAWGLSRIADYLHEVDEVDAERLIVFGHSRLGKTALWAAAQDERFAIAISNNSGCGGAALSRRGFGETVARINRSFPHWFCTNFKRYNGNEDAMPVDQHMLIASIAPRPVYVASATEDLWADPKGEFLSALAASPTYRLFGREGITQQHMPDPDRSIGDAIGYHLRTGKHNITEDDWIHFIKFSDKHLGQ